MSRSSLLILVGIVLVILPFAGIPSSWVTTLVPLLGLVVCVTGFSVRETQVQKEMSAEVRTEIPVVAQAPAAEPAPHKSGVSPI